MRWEQGEETALNEPQASLLFRRAGGSPFHSVDEGLEFASLEAAEYEAACAAVGFGRDWLPKGEARGITIEVKNEHGRRVRM